MTTYTVKQISELINFSVPTTIKKLNKLNLKPVIIKQNGKKIKAYNLNDEVINKLKSDSTGTNQNSFSPISDNNNYFNEYMEAYKELIELKSEKKLLTDNLQSKEGFYVSEINRLTNQNKDLMKTLKTVIISFITGLLIVLIVAFYFIKLY